MRLVCLVLLLLLAGTQAFAQSALRQSPTQEPAMRSTTHVLAFIVVVPLLAWGACSSSNNDKHDGSADSALGSGGRTATGGAAGSATGGNVGSGGRATGGAWGSGGSLGSGGATRVDGGVGTGGLSGSGGRATGVTTGSGGAGGSDAARPDGAMDQVIGDAQVIADARVEVGRDAEVDRTADAGGADGPLDAPMGTDSAPADGVSSSTLESCFIGLPAQVGAQMIATKSSADGRVRMRIVLDTEDRGGSSGTLAWGIIRLAVEVDGVVACITDRSALRYNGGHHNCSDTATAQSGTTTYSLVAPDRPTTTLTIESDGTTAGPYTLTDATCTMLWSIGTPITCRSGGPC
jgi:hypothetical protein